VLLEHQQLRLIFMCAQRMMFGKNTYNLSNTGSQLHVVLIVWITKYLIELNYTVTFVKIYLCYVLYKINAEEITFHSCIWWYLSYWLVQRWVFYCKNILNLLNFQSSQKFSDLHNIKCHFQSLNIFIVGVVKLKYQKYHKLYKGAYKNVNKFLCLLIHLTTR
jgi:hypothetical protein